MKKELLFSTLALTTILGCTGTGETADTSPAKPMDSQTRLQNIENSNMTPEQKRQAAEYVRQGMTQAERQKQAADNANTTGAN